jgi:hypothetical protein
MVFTHDRGRPSFDVPKEQLELFIEIGFSILEMANMLGMSTSTNVYKQKQYYDKKARPSQHLKPGNTVRINQDKVFETIISHIQK